MSSERSIRMNTAKAAEYLGLSPSTLAKMRMRGDGPDFMKLGTRRVLYDKTSLDEWLKSRVHRSTSEYEG